MSRRNSKEETDAGSSAYPAEKARQGEIILRKTVAAHRVHRGITRTLGLLPHRVAAGVEVVVNGIYLH